MGNWRAAQKENELGRELERGCCSPQFLDSSSCSEKDMSWACRNEELETALETKETANPCNMDRILMPLWITHGALWKLQILDLVGQRVFISRRLLSVICYQSLGSYWEWQWLEEWKIRVKRQGGRSKGFKEQRDGDVSTLKQIASRRQEHFWHLHLLRFAHGLRNNGKTPSS